jgi:hypothetical protein
MNPSMNRLLCVPDVAANSSKFLGKSAVVAGVKYNFCDQERLA